MNRVKKCGYKPDTKPHSSEYEEGSKKLTLLQQGLSKFHTPDVKQEPGPARIYSW